MMSPADKEIGRLVLERGLVSREALQQAGATIMSRRQAGQQAEVLQILVEQGALAREAAAGIWQEVHGGAGAPPAHPVDPQGDSAMIRAPAADPSGFGPPAGYGPPTDPSGFGPPAAPGTQPPGLLGAGPPIPQTLAPGSVPPGGFGGGSDFSPMGESFGAPPPQPTGFGADPGAPGSGFGAPASGFGAPGGPGAGPDPLAAMSPAASTTGSGPAAPVKRPVSSRRLQRTASGRAVTAPKRKRVSGRTSRPSGRTSAPSDGGGGGGLGLIAGSLVIALGLVGGAAWYVHSQKAAQVQPDSPTPVASADPSPTAGSPPPSSPAVGNTPTPVASATPRPTRRPTPRPSVPDTPLTIDTPERLQLREDMSQEEIDELSHEWADELISKATDLTLEDNLKDAVRVLQLFPKELPNTPGERRAKEKLAEYEACLGFVKQLQDALDEGRETEQLVRLIKRIEGGQLTEAMAELRAVEVFVNRARELIGGERYDQLAFEAQDFDED